MKQIRRKRKTKIRIVRKRETKIGIRRKKRDKERQGLEGKRYKQWYYTKFRMEETLKEGIKRKRDNKWYQKERGTVGAGCLCVINKVLSCSNKTAFLVRIVLQIKVISTVPMYFAYHASYDKTVNKGPLCLLSLKVFEIWKMG